LSLLYLLVLFAALSFINFERVFAYLHDIPAICSNSKRNRLPSLFRFLLNSS
jgi:hypothetical protein